jgi:prepilin-type N-terminal cleavage/methylation domain-containing protein
MRAPLRHTQRGYTLIELSISIIIALFLMAGLLTLVMNTRNTSTTQAQMQQLQENEVKRIAAWVRVVRALSPMAWVSRSPE